MSDINWYSFYLGALAGTILTMFICIFLMVLSLVPRLFKELREIKANTAPPPKAEEE